MPRFVKWLSLIRQIFKSCLIPNTWKRLPKTEVLLIGHEHHYNFLISGKLYSPILGSLFYQYQKEGVSASIILKNFSALSPSKTWQFHYNYNRTYVSFFPLIILGKALFFFQRLADERRVSFWRTVFISAAVKRILVIQPDRYMCRAAKDLNVPIADVQHGVIGDMHLWYGERFNAHIHPRDLPDEYWVWDEDSRKTIEKWASQKGIKVFKKGHFWAERFKNADPNDSVVAAALEETPKRDEGKPSILVTLQWDLNRYASGPDFNGFMHQQLEDYIFETADKYNWFIRLHPVHLYSDRKKASLKYLQRFEGEPSIDWRSSTFCALPALLSVMDLHITFSSSVVIEAEWFGLKSAILDVEMAEGGCRDAFYITQKNNGVISVLRPYKADIDTWIQNSLS